MYYPPFWCLCTLLAYDHRDALSPRQLQLALLCQLHASRANGRHEKHCREGASYLVRDEIWGPHKEMCSKRSS